MNKKEMINLLVLTVGHIAALEKKVQELTRAGLFDELDDLRALIENLVEDKIQMEAEIEKAAKESADKIEKYKEL